MRGPRTVLLVFTETKPQLSNRFLGIDLSTNRAEQPILREEKAARLSDNLPATIKYISQAAQLSNPDGTIVFEIRSTCALLSEYADSLQGSGLADIVVYRRFFWELEKCANGWELHQSSPDGVNAYSGMHFAVKWDQGRGPLAAAPEARIQGRAAWGNKAVVCAWLGRLPAGLYLGTLFDNSAAAIVPKNRAHLAAIWCFVSSPEFLREVRKINHKPQVANATLVKVPFDLAYWQGAAAEKYPDGLPMPSSGDPTQWLFDGHPQRSDQPLHVAVSRLLGYRWPRQTGYSLLDCPALAADGLEAQADDDGIVCVSATKGEATAAERLRGLLLRALGKFDPRDLIFNAGPRGSKAETLEEWLRDEFFEQHCELFHHRPFIWHIWDGHKSGFSALVNYHQLTHANLEKLAYAYLGDWIRRQQAAVDAGEAGSDARLQAAKQLQVRLKLILDGEPPYDIFVRWKPASKQAIGWSPDINDGVRVNIRPFATADVLRKRVKIEWEKDRGKEPVRDKDDFPWFWGWDEKEQDFAGVGDAPDGNRWNDCHYTNEFKRKANAAR